MYEIKRGHWGGPSSQECWVATLYTCEHCGNDVEVKWSREHPDLQAWVGTQLASHEQSHLTGCTGFGSKCGRCGAERDFFPNIGTSSSDEPHPGYASCRCFLEEQMAESDASDKALILKHWNEAIHVTGFTGFSNAEENYSEPDQEEWWAHVGALIRWMRETNCRRGGFWHQHSGEGIPIFNTGKVLSVSMRTWGHYMWMAHDWDSTDVMGYCTYAWYGPEET